ncbi:hypothetical protein FY004_30970 [Streptomyces parvus]|uniref:Uncharacterized protein n=1 Tax=Streptomyces parvus TaxID=66428 RepID=A0A5D4IJW8_9ACTN|nr:hypothetical protein FY004_30970 [Streptomyces parvus]
MQGRRTCGHRPRLGPNCYAGYLIERALSIDNVFVFALVFSFLAVPDRGYPRRLALQMQGALHPSSDGGPRGFGRPGPMRIPVSVRFWWRRCSSGSGRTR